MRKLLLLLFVGIGITFVNERLQGDYKFSDPLNCDGFATVEQAYRAGKPAGWMCGCKGHSKCNRGASYSLTWVGGLSGEFRPALNCSGCNSDTPWPTL